MKDYLYILIFFIITGCSVNKSVFYDHYLVEKNEILLIKENYLEVERLKDSIKYYFPYGYDAEYTFHEEYQDSVVSVHPYEKLHLISFYWKPENKKLIFGNKGKEMDTISFEIGDTTSVKNLPFYFEPYKEYNFDLYQDRKYSNGKIYAVLDDIINIKLESKIRKKAYRVIFIYENFKFDDIKPDTLYLDYHSKLPIRIDFNQVINPRKSHDFISSKIELSGSFKSLKNQL